MRDWTIFFSFIRSTKFLKARWCRYSCSIPLFPTSRFSFVVILGWARVPKTVQIVLFPCRNGLWGGLKEERDVEARDVLIIYRLMGDEMSCDEDIKDADHDG